MKRLVGQLGESTLWGGHFGHYFHDMYVMYIS